MLATVPKTIAATGLVYTGGNQLYSVSLTAGSDTATVTVYDWTSATGGYVVCKLSAVANTTTTRKFSPLKIFSGIYAVVTGTTPSVTFETDGAYTSTSSSTSTTTTSSSTSTTSTTTTI